MLERRQQRADQCWICNGLKLTLMMKLRGNAAYDEHKEGRKSKATDSQDYKPRVEARSCRQPSFLGCLCGWAERHVSVRATPQTFWGTGRCLQHYYVVATGLCALPSPQKSPEVKHGSGETDEGEAYCPCVRSTRPWAEQRTQPQGQAPFPPVQHSSCTQPGSPEEQGGDENQPLSLPPARWWSWPCTCVRAS